MWGENRGQGPIPIPSQGIPPPFSSPNQEERGQQAKLQTGKAEVLALNSMEGMEGIWSFLRRGTGMALEQQALPTPKFHGVDPRCGK